MYIDWQDLNDGPIKKYWLHGRAWIGKLSICWSIPTHFWMFSFGVNGGDSHDELTFSFGCGLFAIWLSYHFHRFNVGHWSRYSKEKFFIHEERKFDISFHDNSLWLMVWGDPMGDRDRDQKWWTYSKCFDFMNLIFGRQKYSTETIWKGDCLIPMPEGCYKATYEIFISTWERPRLPYKKQLKRITIDCEQGIPHEGKGENSWDCGEDASFGITCIANNLEDGIGKFVSSCLYDRKKYGGKHTHRNLSVKFKD